MELVFPLLVSYVSLFTVKVQDYTNKDFKKGGYFEDFCWI